MRQKAKSAGAMAKLSRWTQPVRSWMQYRGPDIRASLRLKVTLAAILPLIAILSIFTALEYRRRRTALIDNLALFATSSAELIEDNLRHQMVQNDTDGVRILLNSLGQREEFERLFILNTAGEVIFSSDEHNVGLRLDNSDPGCLPCHDLAPRDRPTSVFITNDSGDQIFRSMRPFENSEVCIECHEDEGRLIGLLLTDVSLAPVEATLLDDLRGNLVWWGATTLAVVLLVNAVMSRLVLRRLERLAQAFSAFGQGKPRRLPEDDGRDEIGELSRAFGDMADRIDARRRENRILSERLRKQSAQRGELLKRMTNAQEEERKRVARELHDDLGQRLGGLALRVEVAKRYLDNEPERTREQLDQIRALTTETVAQMYNIILDLRPSILDDLGLVPALRAYANRVLEERPVSFELDASGFSGRLPPELETALFRIFQEAINNIVRHSGATTIRATLASENSHFSGTIEDDGRGFDATAVQVDERSGRGLGLMGMQERAAQCGGRLTIHSQKGYGTKIEIVMPLQEIPSE